MKFKQFLETMSQEGRDEYVAKYRVSGKTFEVWLRVTGPGSARITYLNSYGQGTGTMREALPELMADLKQLNIDNVDWSTAIDDETQGRSREKIGRAHV